VDRDEEPEENGRAQRRRLTRRGFLASTVAAAALAACSDDDGAGDNAEGDGGAESVPSTTSQDSTSSSAVESTAPAATTTTTPPSPVTSDPFTLGVASGDPLPDSVILWTRLLPATGDSLEAVDIDVEWEVATDDSFGEIFASGMAPAIASLAHSVHVDVPGLQPETEYAYRFRVGEFTSDPAVTRTFAAPGSLPDRFRFAFSSCQNWEQGYYAAYRDIVEQDALDAMVFLGDYIYEYASGGYADERGRSTGQDFECVTLDQYRQRYALYKTDTLLQAAHARVPWIITWDDHEVDNDHAGASSEEDADTAEFLERRAAAYQAWYEHMPVRLDPPTGPDYTIYRSIGHGDLIRFHVLDTRQYRSDQQRGEPFVESLGDAVQVRDDDLAFSPEHTMLGPTQYDWLVDGVGSSGAVWDVLAQQVFMFGGNAIAGSEPPVVVVDTWDGYAGERQTLLEAIGPSADNLVVLTGDFHSAAVGDLRSDPFNATLPVVGTEFMATSISSSFFDDDEAVESLVSTALQANPQLKMFDAHRGYTLCEVTPTTWQATYRVVDDQFDESSPVATLNTWEIAAGTPGAVQTG
jgi:alkaline phosphatase D